MPVFFIGDEQVQDDHVTITGTLLKHLSDSLRVRVGDTLIITDPHRRRYAIEVVHLDRMRLRGRIIREQTAPPSTLPGLAIGQALLKGDRMDWVIQKATELGVSRITPVLTARAVIRPRAERTASQVERWQRIALEAAQQAERWEVPVVQPPTKSVRFFAAHPPGLKLILQERREGQRLSSLELPSDPQALITLAIGPEGGWTDRELEEASAAGFLAVTLGGRILRAETAAIAAVAVLQSRLGALG
jgi:16S rRNA (uracil1498-N3)-methyltransferase